MLPDPWLDRWLPILTTTAGARPVLEIGCGPGADTEALVTAGLTVVAFDLSATAVAEARRRVPQASISCQDVRDPLPLAPGQAGAVVASLSLHYFPWAETQAIVARVRQTLSPGDLFLCRLNATNDHHFGATGHPQIAPNYYRVDGQPKRFFDEASVDALFSDGWRVLSKEHQTTGKYGLSKALWEVVAAREG